MKPTKLLAGAVCVVALSAAAPASAVNRELTEFCALYATRYAEFAEDYNLSAPFMATAFEPYSMDGTTYFNLYDLDIAVDSRTYEIKEIDLMFGGSSITNDSSVHIMASLIAMVSALEYDYMEDIYADIGGSAVKKPTERAFDIVSEIIIPAFQDLNSTVLQSHPSTLYDLYQGNYNYYARHTKTDSGWWTDIVAKPNN